MSISISQQSVANPGAATKISSDLDDLTPICSDCERPFLLTSAERLYYRERGYREPERCPICRAAKRAERNGPLLTALEAQEVAAEQAQESVYGTSASQGRRPRAVLYPAICASCGKETQVPFLPRGDRPVYCRECFGQRKGRR